MTKLLALRPFRRTPSATIMLSVTSSGALAFALALRRATAGSTATIMGTRRVPWRDWDEWEEVRAGLTGLDPISRDAALHAVEGWRHRGRVPHAIDVTAQLMEARMHDPSVPGSPGTSR